ncbi:MAG: PEP-CTERM sorting domain-containing protein [Verrucomicrobiae bacterium]|nr:PEP-CTERM sorting domain-containing protein [Verrucomicrobiae bacterium]MDW7980567.1 PEP-CTERM sorting domain-containing protein [Verrucomicrobiales bacterium]
MKKLMKLAAFNLLAAVALANAATFTVDPSLSWFGWMNVWSIENGSQGSYLWGSPWALTDLRAYMTSTTLTLAPNTNTYNPSDPYWVNPDGSGAKWMEANILIDLGTAYGGQTVTFTGYTIANTLVGPYSSIAFIKEFTPGYGWVGMTTTSLVGGAPFTVSRDISPGNIAQFGFMTTGPNANPNTADQLGTVIILAPEPSAMVVLGLGLAGVYLWRRRK